MELCPVCLETNKESPLINIGIHSKVLVCKSYQCIYIVNEDNNYLQQNHDFISKDNNRNISDSSDIEFDLSTSASESDYPTSSNRKKLKLSKYQTLPILRHLTQVLKHVNNKSSLSPPVFNWFGFPIMLKFHIKVCYFLLIHLHLFNNSNNETNLISQLRKLYYHCENVAFQLPNRLVSLASFGFVKYLFEHHDIFKLYDIKQMEMSERILKSMDKFITAIDGEDLHKSIYGLTETCRCCNHKFSYFKEDFTIKLMENFVYTDNNKFNYLTECKKCFGLSQIEIKLERLANFIYIDCNRGVNKNFQELNEIILEKPSKNLKLQGIVELKCPDQFDDIPEKEPRIEEFIMKNAVKPKFEFRIHFRNTSSWYCVDTNSGICVEPISESDIIITPNKVRILIFAEINDPKFFQLNDSYMPIYKVLEQLKKSPKPMVKYPSEAIKYWIILFKYREYCLKNGDNSKSFLTKIATRITAKLNAHLERRQKRTKEKFNASKNEELFSSRDISEDDNNGFGAVNDGNHSDNSDKAIDFTELLVKIEKNNPLKPGNVIENHKNEVPIEDVKEDIWSIFEQEDGTNIFKLLQNKSKPKQSVVHEEDNTKVMLDQLISIKKKKRKLGEIL